MQPYQMVKDLRTEIETGNVGRRARRRLDQFMEGYLRWAAARRRVLPTDA
jgi:peptide chain release factor 2